MYTIFITDLIDNESTNICTAETEEDALTIMTALAETLPKYLDVDVTTGEV